MLLPTMSFLAQVKGTCPMRKSGETKRKQQRPAGGQGNGTISKEPAAHRPNLSKRKSLPEKDFQIRLTGCTEDTAKVSIGTYKRQNNCFVSNVIYEAEPVGEKGQPLCLHITYSPLITNDGCLVLCKSELNATGRSTFSADFGGYANFIQKTSRAGPTKGRAKSSAQLTNCRCSVAAKPLTSGGC